MTEHELDTRLAALEQDAARLWRRIAALRAVAGGRARFRGYDGPGAAPPTKARLRGSQAPPRLVHLEPLDIGDGPPPSG